jgi:hypothetical protein
MAKTPQKGHPMSARWPSQEPLEQVHELNRLFLTFLQSCERDELDSVAFPEPARAALRSASGAMLDACAGFPCALFRLVVEDPALLQVRDPLRGRAAGARHALHLTILLCAWTLSRQSVYQARLLLGLESRAIQRLRSLQLGDLQRLTHVPHLVVCAFPSRDWLWTELLTETRPETRRHLALVALQPGLEREWPSRRPAP